MTSFLIIEDPDPARRAEHLRRVGETGAPVAGMVPGGCGCGTVDVVWWTGEGAPVSRQCDDAGLAVVWGDALGGADGTFMDAAGVRQAWSLPGESRVADVARVEPFDGFHAAAVFDVAARRIVLGADIFGLFPIYYWSDATVMLAASSPALIHRHPRFMPALDPLGLAGLLLTERSVGGRTLLQNVRRVAGSHLLVREAGSPARELRQYRFVATDRCHGLAFDDQIALIDHESERAIRRQSKPAVRQATLLSGGRDSRMVASYLVDQGERPAALTFGRPMDHDAVCARKVARRLGLTRRLCDYSVADYPHFASQLARWEHGSNGFGSVYSWGMMTPLASLGDRVFTGYYLDALLSPPAALADPSLCDFAHVYASHVSRGLGKETLSALLRTDVFGTALEQLELEISQSYLEHGEDATTRAWCFYLWERVRYMIGCVPWRLTPGAWPVLPALDRRWMETLAAMPLSQLVGRRAQDALLRRRFPHLNRTPVARPGDDTTPLEPGLLQRARHALSTRPSVARARTLLRGVWPREHRYYYRINDFNGAGWRAIRREAEAQRAKVKDIFDAKVLATVLPPPDTTMRFNDDLLGAAGLRTLVGVMIWAGQHL